MLAQKLMMQTLKGIKGILVGPNQITTSTSSTATAYSNQRKIDRTSNGVLWTFITASGTGNAICDSPAYSTDDGVTWNVGGSAIVNGSGSISATYTRNWSLFIDLDDYAHVVFKDNGNGYIYYRRGTPNAARTAWTWSAPVWLSQNNGMDYPDVIVHREGTGWRVHAVFSYMVQSGFDRVYYAMVSIDSNGTLTGPTNATGTLISPNTYNNANHKWPSIDFHHTGDGKTVANGTPHLYVAWSAGAAGAGKGIRFKKATYSGGGTWTWGTEREIDSSKYISNNQYWLNCLWDGSRVLLAGELTDDTRAWDTIYSRDDADTTTTQLVLDNTYGINSERLYGGGSSTYDGSGNVFMFGRSVDSPSKLQFRKWDGTSLLLPVVLDATIGTPYVSAKRGYSNNEIEFIYTDGSTSPYNINYGAIK